MFKKALKIFGVVVAVLVVVAAAFYAKAYYATQARMQKVYSVTPQPLEIKADSAQLADGARLTKAKGCQDCHGSDLGGKIFIENSPLGFIVASNLTKGRGGLPTDHNTSDWVLALKHGIRRDGKPLLIMPSHEYTLLTEQDMASIVAYAQSVPAVDRELAPHELKPLSYILTELGKLPLIPSEQIDHSRPLVKELQAEVSVEYGKYLSSACIGCHRADMKGGDPIAPGFPPVANISSSGNPGKWTEEQFMTTLRTGKTPEGKELNPAEMPWKMTQAYTDIELKALYQYLHSL